MNLAGISISVSNLEESIKFYTEVMGFHFFDIIPTGLGRQAILTSGKMRISLFETSKIPNGKIFDMSFLSPDIETDIKKLQAKGAIVKTAAQQGSMAKVAHLADPDGVDIAIVQWNDGFEETEDRIENQDS